ncbi:hypothetical protein IEQ34_001608 [Dendrobium chrysotoxum]|uniref:Uncharacterized protein n=1 Tax=Dendrobium chrysotoxum TaxID=161865 RepID=A0AAV7HPI1_DENCH|nr:hypothetical protein IEQ34_001608 [Dendrobium chrysotoxum]
MVDRTIERKFPRYSPQLVKPVEEKYYRFLRGLNNEWRHPLEPLRILVFSELDMNKKRVGEEVLIRESREKKIKFSNFRRGPMALTSSVPKCIRCGRRYGQYSTGSWIAYGEDIEGDHDLEQINLDKLKQEGLTSP